MAPTETQVRESLALGVEYLSRMSRRIRRPDQILQTPPETNLAVSHDSPGVALTRVIPKNNGQVASGPETVSTTGVALPVLKMRGDPVQDFDFRIIGIPDHGGVTNVVTSGPTLSGDTWTFEQTGDYSFAFLEGDLDDGTTDHQVESSWSVRYKSTWSDSGSFDPRYQISVKRLSGPELGGVLAWDNFAVVPETTQSYTVVVDQTGEQPAYRSHTAFHTTRYHKNLYMANRHLALYSANAVIRRQLPYLDNFWRQYSDVNGQEANDPNDRVIDHDLYDGLWGVGGDRETPSSLANPPWLVGADVFYDPDLYPKLLPAELSRAPYRSHAASAGGNLGYRNTVWAGSPQKRIHAALQQLWGRADTELAWRWLKTVTWEDIGIKTTARPDLPGGITMDAYKGNWLAIWTCAVSILEAYLQRTGDPSNRLAEVQAWADQATEAVIKAQVPASGLFQDYTLGSLCQPEHAGGVFNGYIAFDSSHHQARSWPPGLFGIMERLGSFLGVFRRDSTLMPHHYNTPTSYEPTYWSMIGLTYYLCNRSGQLRVGRVPHAPTGLSAESGNSQITLVWAEPDDRSITRYQVRTRINSEDWQSWTPISDSNSSTVTHTVSGLTNGTVYTFEVRAVNVHGVGAASQIGPVTPQAPNLSPDADAGPDQTVETSASVTLDGSGSSDPDGDGLIYSWEQQTGPSVSLSSTSVVSPTFTAPATETTLTFRLRVTDSHGADDTDTVTVRVSESDTVPASPANLSAQTGRFQITLTWDDPDDDSITSYQYRVRFGTNDWGAWKTVSGPDSATIPYFAVGGSSYTVQLRAVNAVGTGPSAEVGPISPSALV